MSQGAVGTRGSCRWRFGCESTEVPIARYHAARRGYLSEPVEQPRRAYGSRADRLGAGSQLPVGRDHGDLQPVSDPRAGHLDDCIVAGSRCVNRVHATFATSRCTLPRGTFEDQDDLVLRQFRGGQLLPKSPGRSSAVAPPAVRATAHDVCAVDDE